MNEIAINRRESLYGFEYKEFDERRAPEGPKTRTWEIKQLWQRTHEILRLALFGYSNKEIANVLGLHPGTISNTLNSEIAKRKLSEMRLARDKRSMDIMQEIDDVLLPKAVGVYNKILSDEKAAGLKLQKETADTIVMDIKGHRAPTKFQGEHMHAHATIAELEEIKKRGIAAARASGMLVESEETMDAEVVE